MAFSFGCWMLESVLHVESYISRALLSREGRGWLLRWLRRDERVDRVVSTTRVPSSWMYSMVRGDEEAGRARRSQWRYGSLGREEAFE